MVPSRAPAAILDCGCGTGFLTAALARRFPLAQIDAVDLAPGMIDLARRVHDERPRLTWHAADIRGFTPSRRYDLIAGSAAFQWMPPYDLLFGRLRGMLNPAGCLAGAVLVKGTLGELRRARLLAAPQKALSRDLPEADEIAAAVESGGFEIWSREDETVTETHPSAASFLRSIKEMGFTGGLFSAAETRLTRRDLESLQAALGEVCGGPGGEIKTSFRVFYFTAGRG